MAQLVSRNALINNIQPELQYDVVNIKIVVETDQFEIIWDSVNGSESALERYRTLCCILNLIPPSPSDPITWTHLVDLFFNLHHLSHWHDHNEIQAGAEQTLSEELNGAIATNITGWFRYGVLSSHTNAYIFENFPWKAVIISSKFRDNATSQDLYRPSLIKNKFLTRNHLLQGQGFSQYSDLSRDFNGTGIRENMPQGEDIHRNANISQNSGSFWQSALPPSSTSYESAFFKNLNSEKPQYLPESREGFSNLSQLLPSRNSLNTCIRGENIFAQQSDKKIFYPSTGLQGNVRVLNAQQIFLATSAGINLNLFKKNISTQLLKNIYTLDSENCALRIVDIHSQSTFKEFFDAIRTGKVYHFHHLPSQEGKYHNCAANLVFFNRHDAEAFKTQCDSSNGVIVHGQKIRAIWNRDKSGPIIATQQSRVITVFGLKNLRYLQDHNDAEPIDFMSIPGLVKFFQRRFYFNLVETREKQLRGGYISIQFAFGSTRCQGEFAHTSLQRYLRAEGLCGTFCVAWARDPCDGV